MLITNCQPILGELMTSIDHFQTYNKTEKLKERFTEDYSIKSDIVVPQLPGLDMKVLAGGQSTYSKL